MLKGLSGKFDIFIQEDLILSLLCSSTTHIQDQNSIYKRKLLQKQKKINTKTSSFRGEIIELNMTDTPPPNISFRGGGGRGLPTFAPHFPSLPYPFTDIKTLKS